MRRRRKKISRPRPKRTATPPMTPPTIGPMGVFFFVEVEWSFELPEPLSDPDVGVASELEESLVGCGALDPLSSLFEVREVVSVSEERVVVNQVLPVWPR